jgi:hypothetical protein
MTLHSLIRSVVSNCEFRAVCRQSGHSTDVNKGNVLALLVARKEKEIVTFKAIRAGVEAISGCHGT